MPRGLWKIRNMIRATARRSSLCSDVSRLLRNACLSNISCRANLTFGRCFRKNSAKIPCLNLSP